MSTASHILQAANRYERQAYDLLGTKFTGYADLRLIFVD